MIHKDFAQIGVFGHIHGGFGLNGAAESRYDPPVGDDLTIRVARASVICEVVKWPAIVGHLIGAIITGVDV